MIRLHDITVRYGTAEALRNVSLTIAPGEMAGLLGPNGSGKTTLLRVASGALTPSDGKASLRGDSLRSLSHKERARRMAFVPQRPESVPDLTALDMVLMGRYPHRRFLEDYTPEDAALARRALRETAADHLAERLARTLSGGELQRVLIARAFAQATDILLLDEPATGLDPAHATAVFDRVLARKRRSNVTVLTAIHDLNLAALYCDRLIFLKEGLVVADGPTAEVFTAATLERVYESPFLVLAHPVTGRPQALNLPGRNDPHGNPRGGSHA